MKHCDDCGTPMIESREDYNWTFVLTCPNKNCGLVIKETGADHGHMGSGPTYIRKPKPQEKKKSYIVLCKVEVQAESAMEAKEELKRLYRKGLMPGLRSVSCTESEQTK